MSFLYALRERFAKRMFAVDLWFHLTKKACISLLFAGIDASQAEQILKPGDNISSIRSMFRYQVETQNK